MSNPYHDSEGKFTGPGYSSNGSDGRVPTYRGSDGGQVVGAPFPKSIAEKRGIKVGSSVRYSATTKNLEAVSGGGKVVGFVKNKMGYSGSGKGPVTQDVVIRDIKNGHFQFVEDRNVRRQNFATTSAHSSGNTNRIISNSRKGK